MRKTFSAAVLVLALCAPAFAGDIPNPSVRLPPPPVEEPAERGETPSDTADGCVTQTVLSLIQSLLALF